MYVKKLNVVNNILHIHEGIGFLLGKNYNIFSNLSSLFTLCIDLKNNVNKIPAYE